MNMSIRCGSQNSQMHREKKLFTQRVHILPLHTHTHTLPTSLTPVCSRSHHIYNLLTSRDSMRSALKHEHNQNKKKDRAKNHVWFATTNNSVPKRSAHTRIALTCNRSVTGSSRVKYTIYAPIECVRVCQGNTSN